MATKEVKQLIAAIHDRGWTVERTRGSHFKAIRANCQPIYFSSTPRCRRSTTNTLADIRRAEREAGL